VCLMVGTRPYSAAGPAETDWTEAQAMTCLMGSARKAKTDSWAVSAGTLVTLPRQGSNKILRENP
jgi:hypothetical protein